MLFRSAARHLNACELKNNLGRILAGVLLVIALCFCPLAAVAQQPSQPGADIEGAGHAPVVTHTLAYTSDSEKGAQPPHEAGAEEHDEEEHGMLAGLLWPTVNFLILAGGLWWFLREPVTTYLRDRHSAIRKDLVEAANVKSAAAAQLAEIDRKLAALPGEIEALRQRGADEIAAEERRISAMAAAERDRLLEQTRREIDLQVRLAKRELVEHAASLAVEIAGERIQQGITPADQSRLVDRYLDQVKRPNVS
jgi:F-type H+-transporting ATPase subunit b